MSQPDEYVSSEGLKCPYCGRLQEEDIEDLITYWGDENWVDQTCKSCDQDFHVQENVTRTWTTVATRKETDD